MDGIFVSYRRGPGASEAAGRLADRLAQRFGASRVFMDVDTVRPGMDFVDAIEGAVGSCDTLIAVIDPRWAGDGAGNDRIRQTGDYVRLEVATALRREVKVIPVLVLGAPMPNPGELPADLVSLSRKQALTLTHERFNRDVEVLLDDLDDSDHKKGHRTTHVEQPTETSQTMRRVIALALGFVVVAAWILALAYERGQEGLDTFGWHPYSTDIYIVPLRVTAVVTLGVLSIFLIVTRPRR